MSILVINAGSSSVKFGLFHFETLEPMARGILDFVGSTRSASIRLDLQQGEPIHEELDVPDYRSGVIEAVRVLRATNGASSEDIGIRAVGHRLIHGGEEIRGPVRIDAKMKQQISHYSHLAPLHIPAGLEAIEAIETTIPNVPQIGLFDTSFFADIPPCDYLYPLPYAWYEQWGIRRFGFHGTSHAYCTERASEMLACDTNELNLVICHLGQGASATAVRGGIAISNTMGFTPLEGLMMGTRSGTVDPGILLYVQREHGITADELDEILHKKSGLLGISGLSSDFRQVQVAASEGNHRAQLALDIYVHRIRAMIGALTVTLGRIDAVVFTGGIGENSSALRHEVCKGLGCIGVWLDEHLNTTLHADCDVSTPESPSRVLVIHTREDYMIARDVKRMV